MSLVFNFLIGCGKVDLIPFERPSKGDGIPWQLPIPYQIDSSITEQQRIDILIAMDDWSNKTDVTFVKKTDEQDYVVFVFEEGVCSSYVGKMGGKQEISLENGCLLKQVTHEIGHAMGLFHEQQRNDRDSFIKINLEELEDEKYAGNFTKIEEYKPNAPYDYDSIMHYHSTAFGKGNLVIERLIGEPEIDPPGVITEWDVQKIQEIYSNIE